MKTLNLLAILLGVVALLVTVTAPVRAAVIPRPGYELNLALQSPVDTQASGLVSDWKTTEFVGGLKLTNLFPGALRVVSPWVKATQNFGGPDAYMDNRILAGLDIPLTRELTLFSYFDRFTDHPSGDRVFVGLRWGGRGVF